MAGERTPALMSCLSKMACFKKEDVQGSSLTQNEVGCYDVRRRNTAGSSENKNDSKRQQTKQWLQDLSTIAHFDTSNGEIESKINVDPLKG